MYSLLLVAVTAALIVSASCLPLERSSRSTESNGECTLCEEAIQIMQELVFSNATLEDLLKVAVPICEKILKPKEQRSDILCPGILESYLPVTHYVLSHTTVIPREVCAVLRLCPKSIPNKERRGSILVQSPPTPLSLPMTMASTAGTYNRKPNIRHSDKNYNSESFDDRISDALKIVQFNDAHLDAYYKEGSATDCGLFICCRSWQPGNGSAGYFGDFNCDLPLRTFDLLLEEIKDIDPDMIFYAGDNPPHDFWNETKEGQLASTKLIVDKVTSHLPGKTIYPTIGNHEFYPQSEYIGVLPTYQDMTRRIAQYWQKWVEFPQEALETIASGGYYTMMIREGLQLVSINSDLWYTLNFYTFLNDDNNLYDRQIEWLKQVLEMAEENGNKVLLLAHIPSGDNDSWPSYGELMLNITKRYGKTIVGILSAHTHVDQFQLIQDIDGIHGVTLISPSVTPFPHLNPSFRVYYMDKTTYQLIDYEQYHLDLKKANDDYARNKTATPKFELTYRASTEYSIPDMSPTSWGSLVERFGDYDELVQKYYYNLYARSKQMGICDSSCMKEVLCQVKNCNSKDYYICTLLT